MIFCAANCMVENFLLELNWRIIFQSIVAILNTVHTDQCITRTDIFLQYLDSCWMLLILYEIVSVRLIERLLKKFITCLYNIIKSVWKSMVEDALIKIIQKCGKNLSSVMEDFFIFSLFFLHFLWILRFSSLWKGM
jgi:hypothetical protein